MWLMPFANTNKHELTSCKRTTIITREPKLEYSRIAYNNKSTNIVLDYPNLKWQLPLKFQTYAVLKFNIWHKFNIFLHNINLHLKVAFLCVLVLGLFLHLS